MSGYRTLHHERLCLPSRSSSSPEEEEEEDVLNDETNKKNVPLPIWRVICSPCSGTNSAANATASNSNNNNNNDDDSSFRLLASCGNGDIRIYNVVDTKQQKEELNAKALTMTQVKTLRPSSNSISDTDWSLGSGGIDVIRNYIGQDSNKHVGDEIIATIRLDGLVSIWENEKRMHQFEVPNATGVILKLVLPQIGGNVICTAIGTLDGNLRLYSTGIAAQPLPPNYTDDDRNKKIPPAGTLLTQIVDHTDTNAKKIITSLAWYPSNYNNARVTVGRSDGTLDTYQSDASSLDKEGSWRRVWREDGRSTGRTSRIRACTYTPDAGLLLVGNDFGDIAMYDVGNSCHKLVAFIQKAHKSFIFQISACLDSKRFVSCSADCTVKVWNVATPNSGPVHTFETGHDDFIWSVTLNSFSNLLPNSSSSSEMITTTTSAIKEKCISCGNDGVLQIYSCDDK